VPDTSGILTASPSRCPVHSLVADDPDGGRSAPVD
jgi:hypothetical protein